MNKSTATTQTAHELEARLFRASWDDGLLDLFFGVGAMAIGAFWAFDLVALGAIVPALLMPFWNPLQTAVIEPRAGLVEFASARSKSNRRKLYTVFWIGFGTLVLFTELYWYRGGAGLDLLRTLIAGVPAILIGVMACGVAAGLKIARFLIYALVFAVCGVVVALADGEPEVAMTTGGAFVTLAGAWLLTRFLRIETDVEGD